MSDTKPVDLPFLRNVKRSSSEKRKIIYVRKLDLHKERKNMAERIMKVKLKLSFFLFLIDLTDNSLFKLIVYIYTYIHTHTHTHNVCLYISDTNDSEGTGEKL